MLLQIMREMLSICEYNTGIFRRSKV